MYRYVPSLWILKGLNNLFFIKIKKKITFTFNKCIQNSKAVVQCLIKINVSKSKKHSSGWTQCQ